MASQLPSPRQLVNTLAYFDKYNYPLTKKELIFWSSPLGVVPRKGRGATPFDSKDGLYFLSSRQRIVFLRKQRTKISATKWAIARRVGEQLKKFPSIAAVFVTGALAMNNCPVNDDIDLMIVTYPNTLWLTRFFVNLYLWRLRRFPGQTSAPNKICPNLWLDSSHLRVVPRERRGATLSDRRFYLAHEILQAKPLWDRANAHSQFLRANSWVSRYLPVAFKSQASNLKIKPLISNFYYLVFWPLNLLFFLLQYIYMKPKMTSERVNLGFAFFHPRANIHIKHGQKE